MRSKNEGRDEWFVRRVAQCMNLLGHAKIMLKTDREKSIVACAETFRKKHQDTSPREQLSRRSSTQRCSGTKCQDNGMPVLEATRSSAAVAIRAAANLITNCWIGEDERTPFERIEGGRYWNAPAATGKVVQIRPTYTIFST